MIRIPKEIIDVTEFDDKGNRVLKEGVTEKQKRIFKQFYRDLEKNSDVEIEYQE